MPYSVASSSGVVDHNLTTEDSIVRAMDRFVTSFARMEETIMVPSRLKDMPVTVHFHKGTTQLPSAARHGLKPVASTGSAQLVISNGKSETKVVDMYNIYEVLQSVRQELSLGLDDPVKYAKRPTKKALVHANADGNSSGYNTPDSDEAPSDMGEDETLEEKHYQLAALFRMHMQGLFTVLHQMTDAADLLRKTYAESVGGAM